MPWSLVQRVEDLGTLRLMHTGQSAAVFTVGRAFSEVDWHELNAFLRSTFPAEKLSLSV